VRQGNSRSGNIPPPAAYATVAPPAGYTVAVEAAAIPNTDAAIEKITVSVSRDGRSLLSVEDFKVNR
jgi:hypothetical protein